MINGLFIFNQRGDILISKLLKEGVKRNIPDIFKIQVILNVESKSPVLTLGSTTFLHIKCNGLYLVVVTRSNTDASAILEFLYSFKELLTLYFQGLLTEELIKLHFMTVYDLIENVLQFGYPQSMNFNQLKLIIPPPEISKSLFNRPKPTSSGYNSNFSLSLRRHSNDNSSDVPWRSKGIKHKKNEVYLEVVENLNVLIAQNGTILKSFINGEIEMISKLSGTPHCVMKLHEVAPLQDFKFHKCVELEKFDLERVIQFIPPDGEFKVLHYKSSNEINLPFSVKVNFNDGIKRGRGSVEYKISLKSLYDKKFTATDFILKIPVSFLQVNDYEYELSAGDLKYNKTENLFEWKVSKIQGLIENVLTLQIQPEPTSSSSQITKKLQSRPPIYLCFEILSNPNSLQMNYFNIIGESYKPTKWIRYLTKVQSFEVRY